MVLHFHFGVSCTNQFIILNKFILIHQEWEDSVKSSSYPSLYKKVSQIFLCFKRMNIKRVKFGTEFN